MELNCNAPLIFSSYAPKPIERKRKCEKVINTNKSTQVQVKNTKKEHADQHIINT